MAMRAEHLLVTPATGPVTHVRVCNRSDRTYRGRLVVRFPDGWKMNRTEADLDIPPGQTVRVAFAIERGTNSEANAYTVEMKAVGAGRAVTRTQRIVCASAPYSKPQIDGRIDDWQDAIPVTFITKGKETTIRTYWSRRKFYLLAAVQEEALKPMAARGAEGGFDAVQIALSAQSAKTPTTPAGTAQRHEFLLAAQARAAGGYDGRCFALLQAGQKLSVAAQERALAGLALDAAEAAVARRNGVTYYECSIPFKALAGIHPAPGRELCLSLLLHDPDGTGLRDWGRAAGLWPWQRSRLAWCAWQGAQWPESPPFDNKIEWGLCSSKH